MGVHGELSVGISCQEAPSDVELLTSTLLLGNKKRLYASVVLVNTVILEYENSNIFLSKISLQLLIGKLGGIAPLPAALPPQ